MLNRYRFGFNGQENDKEVGTGITTAPFWEYDARRAGRWNVDPITFPWISPYAINNNNPIFFNDPDGDCPTCPPHRGEMGNPDTDNRVNLFTILRDWWNAPASPTKKQTGDFYNQYMGTSAETETNGDFILSMLGAGGKALMMHQTAFGGSGTTTRTTTQRSAKIRIITLPTVAITAKKVHKVSWAVSGKVGIKVQGSTAEAHVNSKLYNDEYVNMNDATGNQFFKTYDLADKISNPTSIVSVKSTAVDFKKINFNKLAYNADKLAKLDAVNKTQVLVVPRGKYTTEQLDKIKTKMASKSEAIKDKKVQFKIVEANPINN